MASPDTFSVPGAPLAGAGSVATVVGRATGDGDGGLEAEIFLDIDLAGSIEVLAPAALMAVPGLLILLSLVAQLVGGVVWIPVAGRVLGGRERCPRSRGRTGQTWTGWR
jgi:hypothetical protein